MLTLHPVPGKAKSLAICKAFAQGAPAHVQGHVFCGVTDGNKAAWQAMRGRMTGRGGPDDFYFIDNSYFDKVRGQQFRITKNGLQHRGLGPTDCKRFDALGIEIQPWRKPTGLRVLTVSQSPDFMRLMASKPMWLTNRGAVLLESLKWTTFNGRTWDRNKGGAASSLPLALKKTDLLVTYSSAAAVEAVLAGVCVDTSAATPAHLYSLQMQAIVRVGAWDCLDSLIPDRRHWAGVLADNQFTLNEMKDGTAWATLAKN